ncbi:MAG: response regulator [Eubacteriales bacterium]|nr:response regulator [Eubacteriales bacterium]
MKILIVDDEELTRSGLASSIDWKALHIDEVLQADDGINGLEAALRHKPEIVLCDMRMPRMDGVVMMERIHQVLPDTVSIFMSGYSDKEYLMAAIKLRAINYIEKPLQPQEVYDAILAAQHFYNQKQHSHHGEAVSSIESASRLAHQLTLPHHGDTLSPKELAAPLPLSITQDSCFTSIIVNLNASAEVALPSRQEIYLPFRDFLKNYHLDCIYTARHSHFLVYFVFGENMPSDTVMKSMTEYLHRLFTPFGPYYMALGETFRGISRAYQSYTSAVVLLQSSYFFPVNTCLTTQLAKESVSLRHAVPTAKDSRFSELLTKHDREKTTEFLAELYRSYEKNTSFLANQVKDVYYKLFLILEETCRQQQIHHAGVSQQENTLDALEHAFSYDELHQVLFQRTDDYFTQLQNTVAEHPTIFTIREYIGKNYSNETLSVKDISDHVFLSTSYVCTFFKNETGQTLNQYLTEYRMEKAKALLADPRYKITDISSRVGYSDGNYFGKSFKKYTGLTPSEYREKMGAVS